MPIERSVKLALRTQQVLGYEAGLTEVIDPLAGSYYVEALTTEIEWRSRALMDEIEQRGGVIAAIESGWTQQQIADASYERQRQVGGRRASDRRPEPVRRGGAVTRAEPILGAPRLHPLTVR